MYTHTRADTRAPNVNSTLWDLAATPHYVKLCWELKKLTVFASGSRLVDMVGTSCSVPSMGKDPVNRGVLQAL